MPPWQTMIFPFMHNSCNSKEILKLQRILYSAARLVKKLHRYHHNMSCVLKDLRWLSIRNRVTFKLCCFVHKAVYGMAPGYLSGLILPAVSQNASVSLRSHSSVSLTYPLLNSVRSRAAFCVSAPVAWNSLPANIRSTRNFYTFKRHLKHFLM